jgi:hypothetical protein
MTQSFICIKSGEYRGEKVENMMFPLVKQFHMGAKGGFVTVDGTAWKGQAKIRVKVEGPMAYYFVDKEDYVAAGNETAEDAVVEAVVDETDEQIMSRIGERFEILDEMAKAAIAGDVRAMIVTGPPGVGKSYSVEAEVEKASTFDKIAGRKIRSEVVKGASTAIGLYCTLFKYSDPGNVLVFDDCDNLFYDPVALNILKGALDTGKKRKISWLADSAMLRREDVPSSFEFRGSIIFITNLNFTHIKTKSIKDHLNALESRCHYVDLTINTTREKILRIKQVISNPEFADDYKISQVEQESLVGFLFNNQDKFREISIRTVIKLIGLYKTFPTRWESVARTTMMK